MKWGVVIVLTLVGLVVWGLIHQSSIINECEENGGFYVRGYYQAGVCIKRESIIERKK